MSFARLHYLRREFDVPPLRLKYCAYVFRSFMHSTPAFDTDNAGNTSLIALWNTPTVATETPGSDSTPGFKRDTLDADRVNDHFWSEPCGSTFADERGIDVSSLDGIWRFDDAYFQFYPYMVGYLSRAIDSSSSVVEVGLGLGTVSRWLASRVPDYVGIDVAEGAVEYVKSSFQALGLKGSFQHRSILHVRDEDIGGQVDCAIAIGCLHHTGNLAKAVAQLEALVRPGGRIMIMVYNEFAPRRILHGPWRSIRHLRDATSGGPFWWAENDSRARGTHDRNSQEEPPPLTEFCSARAWSRLSRRQVTYSVKRENFHSIRVPWTGLALPRDAVLATAGRLWGTDLYVEGRVPETSARIRE